MPAKRFIRRLLSGPLGLILIAFSTIVIVSLLLGEPQYLYVVLYGLAWLLFAPVYWLINSPDRGAWLATAASVSLLLVLLWWLRRKRERNGG